MNIAHPIRRYQDFARTLTLRQRVSGLARRTIAKSLGGIAGNPQGRWLRFLYYHYVFDDQRRNFARQLRRFSSVAEFISVDDAVRMVREGVKPDGRYLCLSFDDGFANCHDNAAPILADHSATAVFFVPDSPKLIEFMSWDQCRAIRALGMTFGSHSTTHTPLAALDNSAAKQEMQESRKMLTDELRTPCLHFCAPLGKAGRHYLPDRDYALARSSGYESFHTTNSSMSHEFPGIVVTGREHVLAHWSVTELRYVLGL